jgi:hypothetical protein
MRRMFVLLAFAAAVSCGGGDSSTSPSDTTVSGTYTLRTVNRLPLPYTVAQNDSVTIQLLSDAFTLTEAKTWTELATRRATVSGQATTDSVTDAGTYVLNGTNITLISANGSTDGTVGGGVLTLANDAVIAVYQK